MQTLLDDITNFNNSFLNVLKQKIVYDTSNFEPPQFNTEEYTEIFDIISNPFVDVKTEYLRLKTLENMSLLVRPNQIVVGEQLNDKLLQGRVILEPKSVKITLIPLRLIFKQILEHSNYFDVILDNLKILKENDV